MNPDQAFMRRALRLAAKGRGRVSPQPLDGALLVQQGDIVGQAARTTADGPSAVAQALQKAGAQAQGATLYTPLEPDAEQLCGAGVERLVCALEDPALAKRGRQFRALRQAGIRVEIGLLATEAARLNAVYLKYQRTGRPWVVLKLAQTLDGRIATHSGDSRWITGEKARTHAHRWRSWVDAIMIGAGTVLADDPRLTVRHVKGHNPRPLVIDGRLRVSPQAQVFARPDTVLVTDVAHTHQTLRPFSERGVQLWPFCTGAAGIDLQEVMQRAAAEEITSILIEGGGRLAAAALDARIVDQVMIFIAPRILGEGIAAVADLRIINIAQALNLTDVHIRRLGVDLLYTAEVSYPCSPD
jgi:diaminohydroxyphosphoribosylaminopyrimidine deaminase/5-amino-6-(5-phosphoribosylamino)uracil reductase